MYQAIKIQDRFVESLHLLAKRLLTDIITDQIEKGRMTETKDGHYSIHLYNWPDSTPDILVYKPVALPYNDSPTEPAEIDEIHLTDKVYIKTTAGEEIYFTSLPLDSQVRVCNELEDIWDEEGIIV